MRLTISPNVDYDVLYHISFRIQGRGDEKPMTSDKRLFTPAEAAKFLSERAGREINANRLAQLRRAGKVKATRLGYNQTVYTREDLENADVSLGKVGRKPKQGGDANSPSQDTLAA